jgi:hypothetical protein
LENGHGRQASTRNSDPNSIAKLQSEQKSRILHYLRTGYFLNQGSPRLIAIISVKGLAKAIGQKVTL